MSSNTYVVCEAQNALNGKPTTVGDPSRWTWAPFQNWDWFIVISKVHKKLCGFSLALMFKQIKFKGTDFGPWFQHSTDLSNMWESRMSRKVPEGGSGSAGTAQESWDRTCGCTAEQNHWGSNTSPNLKWFCPPCGLYLVSFVSRSCSTESHPAFQTQFLGGGEGQDVGDVWIANVSFNMQNHVGRTWR